jgi:ribosome-associated heat shock protein Hsp15
MKPVQVTKDAVRLDLWLWAARFYKTRALAQKAIAGGHIELNGQNVGKAAKLLRSGDQLAVAIGESRFEIEVLALSERRGSATIAQTLYRESEASQQRRAAAAELRRLQGRVGPLHRPDGRDRRNLRALKEGGEG